MANRLGTFRQRELVDSCKPFTAKRFTVNPPALVPPLITTSRAGIQRTIRARPGPYHIAVRSPFGAVERLTENTALERPPTNRTQHPQSIDTLRAAGGTLESSRCANRCTDCQRDDDRSERFTVARFPAEPGDKPRIELLADHHADTYTDEPGKGPPGRDRRTAGRRRFRRPNRLRLRLGRLLCSVATFLCSTTPFLIGSPSITVPLLFGAWPCSLRTWRPRRRRRAYFVVGYGPWAPATLPVVRGTLLRIA